MRQFIFILLLVAPLACAFQAGPFHLAVGDTESSSCTGQTAVEADGSYVCEGEADLARGSAISGVFGEVLNSGVELLKSAVQVVGGFFGSRSSEPVVVEVHQAGVPAAAGVDDTSEE